MRAFEISFFTEAERDRSSLLLGLAAKALSHQPLLLVSTYPLAGFWSNKINYLTNISMTAREPLLARRDNAGRSAQTADVP